MTTPLTVAAVDLGSNSAHMIIGQFLGQELRVLDRMREPICLAGGLDAKNRLDEEAQGRAIDCLRRFGQRLNELPPGHVRAVGTNTLRRARKARTFRDRAEEALGHPIEVISGQEEARLIYLGVSHSHHSGRERRLVVDVGGGSTEVILGRGFHVDASHSLFMGCVTYTQRFFEGGEIRRDAFRRAEIQAQLEMRTIEAQLRDEGWEAAIGSSGTINAVRDQIRRLALAEHGITLPAMKKLRKLLVTAGHVDALDLEGVKTERARVLPGGLAILIGVFKALGIGTMRASSRALREGVLYDLAGRIRHEDVRDRTIGALERRYNVDPGQAVRVSATADDLASQLGPEWLGDRERSEQFLDWASRLHEIGLALSHTGFHKHGEYLAIHSDMPGFSADDQRVLAALIRTHRRKLTRALFLDLPHVPGIRIERLAVVLRLAVLLNRTRRTEVTPKVSVGSGENTVRVVFPRGWLDEHPLTQADLEQEASYLRAIKIRLDIREAA